MCLTWSWDREQSNPSIPTKIIECYNCRGLGHVSFDYPSPKEAKKAMQTTYTDSNGSDSLTLKTIGMNNKTILILLL